LIAAVVSKGRGSPVEVRSTDQISIDVMGLTILSEEEWLAMIEGV
jgi:hypothetical protein